MAAGRLPKPGTEYGPCAVECNHIDCAHTREDAKCVCRICAKPIGYDVRYYDEGKRDLVHALCLENEIDANR